MNTRKIPAVWLALSLLLPASFAANNASAEPGGPPQTSSGRLRLIIETDAGGDPDDEQSLVRLLLYTSEWDVEGIIANRPRAREGENRNTERTGLGIVRRQLAAYRQCWTNLVRHDPRYPLPDQLWQRTVAGYADLPDAIDLIIAAADSNDPRPIWYSDWGTDHGAATNNLHRALDRVLKERGPSGYAQFKRRFRLSSADAFGAHTTTVEPPFAIWVDTFRPELDGKRWYHRFSGITAHAGGFDIARDVRNGHGPLGLLYPLNTTHAQKEGDSMSFIYLIPVGMNDPEQPTWGSWAGRYGLDPSHSPREYFWANQADAWRGSTHRENSLARWAVALQHDFAARMDWCVAEQWADANHHPVAVLNGDRSKRILHIPCEPGESITLSAAGSDDPDHHTLSRTWFIYPEAGTCSGAVALSDSTGESTTLTVPNVSNRSTIHVILQLEDSGTPSLFAFRRAILSVQP